MFFCLLLAGIIALCVFRWDAWFTNPAEDTYIAPTEPDNIILSYGNSLSSRTLSWRTAELQPSFVVIDGDTLHAEGKVVQSRSGEAAFYKVTTGELAAGRHRYYVQTGDNRSDSLHFNVAAENEVVRFILFGDIQEKDTVSPFADFCSENKQEEVNADFFVYAGDVIDRPTDKAWQTWFASLHGLQTCVPQLAAVGNHECLKGVSPELDPRWTSLLPLPDNGPERFEGTMGYLDFPSVRIIVLNTQKLIRFSDYTIAQTWLSRSIAEADGRFTVVVMHHSIYTSAMRRYHPLVYTAFRTTLRNADVVVAGHDHVYTRRAMERIMFTDDTPQPSADTVFATGNLCTPVFVVTNSSTKQYLPRCSSSDQRIGSGMSFYEEFTVTPDSLFLITKVLPDGNIYDALVIERNTHNVSAMKNLPKEHIALPEQYEGKNTVEIRRFLNRRSTRFAVPSGQ